MKENDLFYYPSDNQPDNPENESAPEELEAYLQRNREIHEALMKERREQEDRNRRNPRFAFGQWMEDWRLSHDTSLRTFCINHNIDAANYSKLERGILAPPVNEESVIDRLATEVFEIKNQSDEYHEFWERARAAHVAITQAMREPYMPDTQNYPVFVQKADGTRLTDEELRELTLHIDESRKPTDQGNIFKS